MEKINYYFPLITSYRKYISAIVQYFKEIAHISMDFFIANKHLSAFPHLMTEVDTQPSTLLANE